MSQSSGGRCTHVRPFLNYFDLIDCSFFTTNENDVILGRSYVGPVLPLVQWPLVLQIVEVAGFAKLSWCPLQFSRCWLRAKFRPVAVLSRFSSVPFKFRPISFPSLRSSVPSQSRPVSVRWRPALRSARHSS